MNDIEIKGARPRGKDYPTKEIKNIIRKMARENATHFEVDGWALDNVICFWEELIYQLYGNQDLFFKYIMELSHYYGEGFMLGDGNHYPADKIPLYLDIKTNKIVEGPIKLCILEEYKGERRFHFFGYL